MVYHPANAETDEHFSGKQEIIYWFNNGTLKDFEYDDTLDKNQKISVDSFEKNFLKSEDKWEKWVENFNHSIEYCNYNYSSSFGKINYKWDDIKETILNEIVPNIEVRVINSKAEADDRPRFEVEDIGSGNYSNIPDNLSIFVF